MATKRSVRDDEKNPSQIKTEKTLAEITMAERARVAETGFFRSQGSEKTSSAKEPKEPTAGPDSTIAAKPSAEKPIQQVKVKEVSPASHKPPKDFVDNYDLPGSYNTTTLTLIARDPFWIYAYWEIARSSLESVRNEIGSDFDRSRIVLRMYNVTCIDFNGHNANHYFDIEVGHHANNWYINLWYDNVSYCAELGISVPNGRFFPLTRSNFVTTPRASSSNRSEQIWMEVKDNSNQAPFAVGKIGHISNKNKGPAQETNPSSVKKNSNPAHNNPRKRKILLTEEDIKQYYSRLSPLLRDIISARFMRGSGVKPAASNRLYVYIEGNKVALEESIFRGLSRSKIIKRLLLGASEELLVGASESLASESLVKGASEREKRQRKFFFEIGTELIVYGRTEPDAEVFLGDKKIKLRSDGTFTLRFALPDGKIPLDFVAISNDKVDRREIQTSVERTMTRYNP